LLDDLNYIHERDASDALGLVAKQADQLSSDFEVFQDQLAIDSIVYAGMGSSALAAQVGSVWPGYSRPCEVVRGYDIPAYVSDKTYFIAASYSGNTEETLSALEQAEARGATIAVIAGGGRLAEIARAKNYALALLPRISQSRYAVLANLKALVTLLDQAGLLAKTDWEAELTAAAKYLKGAVPAWLPTVPTANNYAKQIALDVIGKSAVIYAGPKLAPAAYKWKIGFNENAKQVAWTNQLPEFNHNEFTGWTEQPVAKPYAVIDLRSNLEHPRIARRFELSERLLSGKRPAPLVVTTLGETILEQLLWTMALGDFVTIYTGLASGLDPTPVALVEKFKKMMEA
jgi:glucose/mannose-6-phosphate isomerase